MSHGTGLVFMPQFSHRAIVKLWRKPHISKSPKSLITHNYAILAVKSPKLTLEHFTSVSVTANDM